MAVQRVIDTDSCCLPVGNLLSDPEAALLFIDFETGDTLHLSGHAEVQWEEADLPGAQRSVAFQTEEWVHVEGALPIKQQGLTHMSPHNPTRLRLATGMHGLGVSTFRVTNQYRKIRFGVFPVAPAIGHVCHHPNLCIVLIQLKFQSVGPTGGGGGAASTLYQARSSL